MFSTTAEVDASLLVGHNHDLGVVIVSHTFDNGDSFKIELPPFAAKDLIEQITAALSALKKGKSK